ncbi:MAG: DNA repair protein RecN [Clostridia bacterium]|jgi:DNA repair protein RecN (Recombination protein N)|nr:DNA repair protein RecN [Clostridiales bacterium]
MLLELGISDFALIDNLRLNLEKGLNVLTGETGAGKSIIIDAVNMVLGERADTEIVRTGAEKAVVEALFKYDEIDGLDGILNRLGIEPERDKTLVLGREIKSGRSISRINGRPVPLSCIRELSRRMIDIHGQHQHQSLLDVQNHIDILDQFGGKGVLKQRERVASLYGRLLDLKKELELIRVSEMERERSIDLYSYQIEEIEKAGLKEGEDEELIRQRDVLANAERIFQSMAQSYQLLYGGEDGSCAGMVDGLGQVSQLLAPFTELDKEIDGFHSAVESSCILLRETARDIRNYLDGLEFDPKRLNDIQERLDLINGLKRKYGNTIEEIMEYCRLKTAELAKLKNNQREQDSLGKEIAWIEKELERECGVLTGLRKEAADYLAKNVTSEIAKLGMTNGSFKVCLNPTNGFTAKGGDSVEFMFSANLGEPLKHLSRIASGGEMSRIMLAIKTCLADTDSIPTLIFDEIDAGISGRTAQVVAQQLASVSKRRQVVCVTHLPQIAAMADNHYLISKEEKDGHTYTRLKALDRQDRVRELARLLGGTKVTNLTMEHSEEMLKMAENLKNSAL